jgi:type IV pilus assembly protein PilC
MAHAHNLDRRLECSPVVILFVAVAVVGFLMVVVVPKFQHIFNDLLGEKSLPRLTRFVFNFCSVMRDKLPVLIGIVIALVVTVKHTGSDCNGRVISGRIKTILMSTPVLEPIMIVFLALVVGTIVIAMFLPLINILGQ